MADLSRSSSFSVLAPEEGMQQELLEGLKKIETALGSVLTIQNARSSAETAVKSVNDGVLLPANFFAGNPGESAGYPAGPDSGEPLNELDEHVDVPERAGNPAGAGFPAGAGYPAGNARIGGNEQNNNMQRAGLPAGYGGNAPRVGGFRRRPTRRDGERSRGFQEFLQMKNAEQRRIRQARAIEDDAARRARDEERAARDLRRRQEDINLQQTRAAEDGCPLAARGQSRGNGARTRGSAQSGRMGRSGAHYAQPEVATAGKPAPSGSRRFVFAFALMFHRNLMEVV
ncbi:translation initiation factor IF-2-like isoform X2 [Paramacrobiotus metropolitanus]|nr:translation initiation factor IF-2-like isoform X2 [Paramacrobiotus metropolitanus]